LPISPYVARLRERVGRELLLMPSAAACVFDAEGGILMVRTEVGWCLPGGVVEPGEPPALAAVRECREETGLEVQATALLGVFGGAEHLITYPNGDRCQYVMTAFACRAIGGEAGPDGDETFEVRHVAAGELASLPAPDWVEHVLPRLWEAHRSGVPAF